MQKPSLTREFRISLVIYGGVSLAIYINGVCREFYEAVRGRGVYRLLKALTDSEIVVDTAAGASAGGINSILLGYALCNSNTEAAIEFREYAKLWRNQGDIQDLMYQINGNGKVIVKDDEKNIFFEKDDVTSFLDGEGFYQEKLKEGIKISPSRPSELEWVSENEEFNLFVTGTDIQGRIHQVLDNTNGVIDVRDHRAVFILKHRQGRKHPFQDQNIPSLAKLCRITSAFPAAFPIVPVSWPSGVMNERGKNDIDSPLVYWGNLKVGQQYRPVQSKDGQSDRCEVYFTDGGVLDNRPFGYVVEHVSKQVAIKPTDRKLFYIDPSPDHFTTPPKNSPQPSFLSVLLASLNGLPSYESIANDLKAINEHNEFVRRHRLLQKEFEPYKPDNQDLGAVRIEAMLPRATSIDGEEESEELLRKQQNESSEYTPPLNKIYWRCRLTSLQDRTLSKLLMTTSSQSEEDNPRTTYKNLVKKIGEEIEELDNSEGYDDLRLNDLDISYIRRKHYFALNLVQKELRRKLKESMSKDGRKRIQALIEVLMPKLAISLKFISALEGALNDFLSVQPVKDGFFQIVNSDNNCLILPEGYILRLYRFFLSEENMIFNLHDSGALTWDPDQPSSNDQKCTITAVNSDNCLDVAKLFDSPDTADQEISNIFIQLKHKNKQFATNFISPSSSAIETAGKSILLCLDEAFMNIIKKTLKDDDIGSFFVNSLGEDEFPGEDKFQVIDESTYPHTYLSNSVAQETIQLYRISPYGANLGLGKNFKPKQKVSGDQVFGFGGFFKKSWRSNDILWGRLDGLNRIVEGLLTVDSIKYFKDFVDRESDGFPTGRKNLIDQLLASSMPQDLPEEKEQIRLLMAKILSLLDSNSDELSNLVDQLQRVIVSVGHHQILNEDLPTVFKDVVQQQHEWNHPPGKFNDPSLTPYAVSESVTQSLDLNCSSTANTKSEFPAQTFGRPLTTDDISELAVQAIEREKQKGRLSDLFNSKDYVIGQENLFGGDSVPKKFLLYLGTRAILILLRIIHFSPGSKPVVSSGVFTFISRVLKISHRLTTHLYKQGQFNWKGIWSFVPLLLAIFGIPALIYWQPLLGIFNLFIGLGLLLRGSIRLIILSLLTVLLSFYLAFNFIMKRTYDISIPWINWSLHLEFRQK